jgi:hypothetical protein
LVYEELFADPRFGKPFGIVTHALFPEAMWGFDAQSEKPIARGRLDGVLNDEMAIRDTKFAGNRFRRRLAGSFRRGTIFEKAPAARCVEAGLA